jgi:zinc and cadmium transporter
MPERSLEIIVSVLAVSLISLVGASVLLGRGKLKSILPLLVALAAGALIGDTFLHLLPHAVEHAGGKFTPMIAWGVLGGLVGFFLIESVLHWHHHGEDVHEHSEEGIHHIGWMNLIGDGFHNFIDGMLIAAAWLLSPEAGLATTIAVLLHEIPQEFGDFGVLLHAGFSAKRAILYNLLSGLAALVGAAVVLVTNDATGHMAQALGPVAAGGFLYIACADLVPEMRKRARGWKLVTTGLALAAGLGLMAAVHEFEHGTHEHDAHQEGHDHEGHEHD